MKSVLVSIVIAALFGCACGKKEEDAGKKAKAEKSRTTDRVETSEKSAPESYTVKGRIAHIPEGKSPAEFEIHHESIPTFKSRTGETTGMESMQMPFALPAGISAQGFAVGDPVRFTFEVHWDEKPMLRITKIEKLSSDTALELSK
jgi:hypothetical protein